MPQPFFIGAREFPSRAAAENHVRSIRDAYEDFDPLEPEDHVFMADLLALHSEAAQKIGTGIHAFYVQVDQEWQNSRHFVVVRQDGSQTDFSFKNCIYGPNPRSDVLAALRAAVVEQITRFRDAELVPGKLCPISGEGLTRKNTHVDHVAPDTFVALATRWTTQLGADLVQLELVPNAPNQLVRGLRDPAQILSWQAFHQASAVLRLISRTANLSTVRRRTS